MPLPSPTDINRGRAAITILLQKGNWGEDVRSTWITLDRQLETLAHRISLNSVTHEEAEGVLYRINDWTIATFGEENSLNYFIRRQINYPSPTISSTTILAVGIPILLILLIGFSVIIWLNIFKSTVVTVVTATPGLVSIIPTNTAIPTSTFTPVPMLTDPTKIIQIFTPTPSIPTPAPSSTPMPSPTYTPSPTSAPHTPVFLMDMTTSGGNAPERGLAVINGKSFQHSLRFIFSQSCCSSSQSSKYTLDENFQHFYATLGLEDKSNSKVTYEVFADDIRVFVQTVTSGDKATNLDLNINNKTTLTLTMTTDNSEVYMGYDIAAWGDAEVSNEMQPK